MARRAKIMSREDRHSKLPSVPEVRTTMTLLFVLLYGWNTKEFATLDVDQICTSPV